MPGIPRIEKLALPWKSVFGNHGFRLHDDQGFSPARIHPALRSPEEAIEAMQSEVGLIPLKNDELLAKSSGF